MAVGWAIDGTKRHRLVPLPSECAPEVDVADVYFEIVYGPLVGPTPVALARNLARRAKAATGPVLVDFLDVAFDLGLRSSSHEPLGATASIVKAVDRLQHRRLLTVLAEGVLGIYVTVPLLDDHFLARVPPGAREFHRRYLADLDPPGRPPGPTAAPPQQV
jgi:hypothetical protein